MALTAAQYDFLAELVAEHHPDRKHQIIVTVDELRFLALEAEIEDGVEAALIEHLSDIHMKCLSATQRGDLAGAEYWRGRFDEHVAQNAPTDKAEAQAKTRGRLRLSITTEGAHA